MKKTVGMLCGLTILSACGTSLDFWSSDNLVDAPRKAPVLNGTPQTPPQSLNLTPAASRKTSVAAVQMIPLPIGKSLVPAPMLNQQRMVPVATAYNVPQEPNGRRMPEFNRNALGKGSSDVLGPVPAPAVSKTPLDGNAPVAVARAYEPPIAPVPKLPSVASNMPKGGVIPVPPSKTAKVTQMAQVAKAPEKAPTLPPFEEALASHPAPQPQSLQPIGPTIVVGSDEKPQTVETPITETPNLQPVAQNMPQGSVVPPATAPKQIAEIRDVPALPSVSSNMPQGSVVPPLTAKTQAQTLVPKGPSLMVGDANKVQPEITPAPIPSVAQNMPKDSMVPPPARMSNVEKENITVPPPQLSDVQVQTFPPLHEVKTSADVAERRIEDKTPAPKLVAQANDAANVPPPPVAKNNSNNVGTIIETETAADDLASLQTPPEPEMIMAPTSVVVSGKPAQTTRTTETITPAPVPTVISSIKPPQPEVLAPAPAPEPAKIIAESKPLPPAPGISFPPTAQATIAMTKPVEAAAKVEEPVKLAEPQVIRPAPAPTVVAAIQPIEPVKKAEPLAKAFPDNYKRDQYPVLASMPPAPKAPQPVDSDPRVQQMQEELRRAQTEDLGKVETKETVTTVQKIQPASILTPPPEIAKIEKQETVTTVQKIQPTPAPMLMPAPAPEVARIEKKETTTTVQNIQPAPMLMPPPTPEITKVEKKETITTVQKIQPTPAPMLMPPPAPKLAALPELSAPAKQSQPSLVSAATAPQPTQPIRPAPAPVQAQPRGVMPEGPTIVISADDDEKPAPAAKSRSDVTPAPIPMVNSAPMSAPQVIRPIAQTPPPALKAPVPAAQNLPSIAQATQSQAPAPSPSVQALPNIAEATQAPAPVQQVAPRVIQPVVVPQQAPAPATYAAPKGYLVPPAAVAVSSQPVYVPVHKGESTVTMESKDEDEVYNFVPVSNPHGGTLAPSRYAKMREGQRNGSGY